MQRGNLAVQYVVTRAPNRSTLPKLLTESQTRSPHPRLQDLANLVCSSPNFEASSTSSTPVFSNKSNYTKGEEHEIKSKLTVSLINQPPHSTSQQVGWEIGDSGLPLLELELGRWCLKAAESASTVPRNSFLTRFNPLEAS